MPTPKSRPAAKSKAGMSKQSADQRAKVFAEAFLSNGENASKAALAAGFSPNSAASQGSRLLKSVKVQQYLQQRRTDLLQKFELNTEAVLRSLQQAVFFDPRKLYRPDGTMKPITELDDDTAMALTGFEVTETMIGRGEDATPLVTRKVKWLDKNVARDQANKILGHYGKDNEQARPQTRVVVIPAKDPQ